MATRLTDPLAARNVKISIIVGCVGTMLLLGLEARREHLSGEWRGHQEAYLANLPEEFQAGFNIELRQTFLPDLDRIDRCQICHIGIDDPSMVDQPQPLSTHPGDYLRDHPVDNYGCTICHQGQGQATWLPDAHGDTPHWEAKMLRGSLVYTSCGTCHVENSPFGEYSEVFSGPVADTQVYEGDLARDIRGTDILARGKDLFLNSGCLGCHTYQGKGGILGPDLTHIGDKGVHGYDFSHLPLGVERTPLAWLTEHFLNPGEVSPGTVMPALGITEQDATDLATYMLSLKSRTGLSQYRPPSQTVRGKPASGGELYQLFCIACHGDDLRSGLVPEIDTPSIANADFLSVAGDDYLRSIIVNGRSDTNMPAWSPEQGGLSEEEVDRLVGYIRGFAPDHPTISNISLRSGDPAMGRAIYRGRCSNCHGRVGEGGIGTALSSPDFQLMASDDLIVRTIVEGRRNAGMPSWKTLRDQDISDVLAFIRTWRDEGADTGSVEDYIAAGNGDRDMGRRLFHSRCAACHGEEGQGLIGPSLNSTAFLSIVPDSHLINSIREGRPGTAMPSWTNLSVQDVGDVVTYLRGLADVEYTPPVAEVTQGDRDNGANLFQQACASCHGQEASGGVGPQLANHVFLDQATEGFLFQTIAYGRPGTAMKGFARRGRDGQPGATGVVDFTRSQIADIVSYLRSLRFTTLDPNLRRSVLGSAARGEQIYNEIGGCARCHGEDGQGDVGPALGNPEYLNQASEGFVLGTMVLGRSGTEMRNFSSGGISELSAEEMMDVAAYVRTLTDRRKEGELTWRNFIGVAPLEEGAQLFTYFCASCHGENGNDGYAPALNNPEFLDAATDGFLAATIARGRQGTPMRAFGPGTSGLAVLTADEIRNLVGFIRSWQSGRTEVTEDVTELGNGNNNDKKRPNEPR